MDGSPIIDRTPIDGPLSQLRLVLRRLQGDAGLGLVLRAPDRARRAAPGCDAPSASTASPPATLIDEKGAGRRSPTCTETPHAHRLSLLRRARRARVHLSAATPTLAAARSAGAGRRRALHRLRLSARQSGRARIGEFWYHGAGCRAWLVVDARHAHARDRSPSRSRKASRWRGASAMTGALQPHRLQRRPDRPRRGRCAFHFDGKRYRRLRRRHAGLGAARQRRQRWSAARSSITARAASSPPARRSRTRWSSCARGARREPNTRATTVELYDGLEAREPEPLAVAALRSCCAINALLAPFFVAGFYYKTFMWPAAFWEKRLRAAHPPRRRPRPRRARARSRHYEKAYALLRRAGHRRRRRPDWRRRWPPAAPGARVILCERGFRARRPAAGRAPRDRRRARRATGPRGRGRAGGAARRAHHAAHHGVRRLRRRHLSARSSASPIICRCRPRISRGSGCGGSWPSAPCWRAGAIERPLVFGGNDRPGVMLASAVRTYVNRFAVAPGRARRALHQQRRRLANGESFAQARRGYRRD